MSLFKVLREIGQDIQIHTGFIDSRLQLSLQQQGFNVTINPLFDRNFQFESLNDGTGNVEVILKQIINESPLTIISQSFLGDAEVFNIALSNLLSQEFMGHTWLRSHDHIRDKDEFQVIDDRTLCLPTTRALKEYIKLLNPNIKVSVLPVFVDQKEFSGQFKKHSSKEVRECLGFRKNDFIIFQPTTVNSRKRIGKSIYLSAMLQKKLPGRRVFLLIAGGNEPHKHQEEKERLITYAKKLGLENLFFLDGLTGECEFRRVSDYIRPGVANIVTFMSEIDAFGVPPLECSIAGVPCITSSFKDEKGYLSFDYNYRQQGFSFILDDVPGDIVSDVTLDQVTRIAVNPGIITTDLLNNQKLAEKKYGIENIRQELKTLLKNIS